MVWAIWAAPFLLLLINPISKQHHNFKSGLYENLHDEKTLSSGAFFVQISLLYLLENVFQNYSGTGCFRSSNYFIEKIYDEIQSENP